MVFSQMYTDNSLNEASDQWESFKENCNKKDIYTQNQKMTADIMKNKKKVLEKINPHKVNSYSGIKRATYLTSVC